MYQYFMDSPLGRLRLVENEGYIKEISQADLPAERLNSEGKIIKATETFVEAVTEKTESLEYPAMWDRTIRWIPNFSTIICFRLR